LKLVAELQKEFMLLNPPSSLLPMLQVQPHWCAKKKQL
jgi:hypothetical protein